MQTQIKLDEIGHARLIKSLELDIAPAWQYRYLSFGRATAPLTVQQIFALVDRIASKPKDGLLIAVDLLGMVIHGTDEKDEIYRSDLASACASFLERLDWSKLNDSNNPTEHDLDVLLNFALSGKRSDTEVSKILLNLLPASARARRHLYRQGKRLAPFFKFYPKQTLDAIYVADEDGRYSTALGLVSRTENDRRETAIGNAPNDAFIEWCDISPKDRYIFAAQTCRLFRKESSDETAEGLVLSEMAIQVLTRALDRKAVLRIFLNRFQPTCWSGSLSAVLKQRLPLLTMLNPTDDPNLRIEIAQAEETLRKQIKAEEAREEAEERRQTGSFE